MVLIHLYVTHQAGLRNRYLVSNRLSGLFFFFFPNHFESFKEIHETQHVQARVERMEQYRDCVMCDV